MKIYVGALTLCFIMSGCGGCSSVFSGDASVGVYPPTAKMAVGARHDFVVVGCIEKVNPLKLITPVVATALFVSIGRVDALFYLPEAIPSALIPDCKPVEFEVVDVRSDNEDFSLIFSENQSTFTVESSAPGETEVVVTALVDGEEQEIKTVVVAEVPDQAEFDYLCFDETDGTPKFLTGTTIQFTYKLARDGDPLAGYGFWKFEQDVGEVLRRDERHVWVRFGNQAGTFDVDGASGDALGFEIEIVSPDDLTKLEVEPSLSNPQDGDNDDQYWIGRSVSFRSSLSVGDDRLCRHDVLIDADFRDDTCDWTLDNDVGGLTEIRYMKLLAEGPCRVDFQYPGRPDLSDSFSVDVRSKFERVAEIPRSAGSAIEMTARSDSDFFVLSRTGAETTTIVQFRDGVDTSSVLPIDARLIGSGETSVWIAGNDIARLVGDVEGGTWTSYFDGENEVAWDNLHIVSDNEVYAAGRLPGEANFWWFDGTDWSQIEKTFTGWILTISGDAENLLVETSTGVYQRQNDVWDLVPEEIAAQLLNDGYVRSAEGGVHKWDGESWVAVHEPIPHGFAQMYERTNDVLTYGGREIIAWNETLQTRTVLDSIEVRGELEYPVDVEKTGARFFFVVNSGVYEILF